MDKWYSPGNFFDPGLIHDSPVFPLFDGLAYVWEALDRLEPFIRREVRGNVAKLRRSGDLIVKAAGLIGDQIFEDVNYTLGDPDNGELKVYHQGRPLPGAALIMPGAVLCGDDIEIGQGALIETGAMIKGPAIIGPRSEVRQGAYIRGAVMSSPGAVIGHATEAKNALLLPGAKAGHFAYLGDSLLGFNVNLGAGTILANLKISDAPYIFKVDGQRFKVDRRKFGAIIGDGTATGCNTVINPGTLLGPNCRVLPNSSLASGYRPGDAFLNR